MVHPGYHLFDYPAHYDSQADILFHDFITEEACVRRRQLCNMLASVHGLQDKPLLFHISMQMLVS